MKLTVSDGAKFEVLYCKMLFPAGITIMWGNDSYTVTEEEGTQGVRICAIALGSSEIYPAVEFTTATVDNSSG